MIEERWEGNKLARHLDGSFTAERDFVVKDIQLFSMPRLPEKGDPHPIADLLRVVDRQVVDKRKSVVGIFYA